MINPLELLILGRRFPLRNIWWTRETSGNPSTFPVFEKVEGFLGIKKERISKIEILFGAKLNHSKGALKDTLEEVSRSFPGISLYMLAIGPCVIRSLPERKISTI